MSVISTATSKARVMKNFAFYKIKVNIMIRVSASEIEKDDGVLLPLFVFHQLIIAQFHR